MSSISQRERWAFVALLLALGTVFITLMIKYAPESEHIFGRVFTGMVLTAISGVIILVIVLPSEKSL